MANRIKEMKTRALEISKASNDLKEQKKINMSDLSVNSELLGIRFEDESAQSDVEALSKAVTDEQNLIDGLIGKNQKDIDKASDETDDYINGLKSNLRKMERMRKTSDLVDVGQQKGDTKNRIGELEDVKRILKRIAAGGGAIVAGAAGAVSPLRNEFGEKFIPETVPAQYQRMERDIPANDEEILQDFQRRHPDFKVTFESAPEEKQPDKWQIIGKIGQTVQDVMTEIPDAIERKRERKRLLDNIDPDDRTTNRDA
jgi:hypothetical protein